MELLPYAAPIIGGLLGGSKSQGQSSTSKNEIDPRLADAIYGKNGSIPAAQDWFNKNRSGLNPQMQQGLNNQAAQLSTSKVGFDRMQNLGLGMMTDPVGNPFSRGYSGGSNFAGQPQQQQPMQPQQPQAYTPAVFDQQPAAAAPAAAPAASTDSMQEMLKWYLDAKNAPPDPNEWRTHNEHLRY